jgi:hypothetical protein
MVLVPANGRPPPLVVEQLPLALLLVAPGPAATPAGTTAHGLTAADIRSIASATMLPVDAALAASVGAVATGSLVAAAPPSGAEAAEVASAGSVAGPLLPLTLALGGAPSDAGCVARVVEPIRVGNMTAGTMAGAAPITGVSPEPLEAASAAPAGVAAVPQPPDALALVALLSPAAPPVGATAQGSVAAAASDPILDGEASPAAETFVGLTTSGVVAPAAVTWGWPAITGATSASEAVAAGLDTSG